MRRPQLLPAHAGLRAAPGLPLDQGAVLWNGVSANTFKQLAERLEHAIDEAKEAGVPGVGEINFEDVRGRVDATVSDPKAAGSITFGSVIAESGSIG
jgi:hypothetical protein